MKKALVITLGILACLVLFSVVFVVVLHVTEYRPKTQTQVDIRDQQDATHTVETNSPITILTFNIGYASLSQTEDFVMDGGKKAKMDSKAEVEVNIEGIKGILLRESCDITLLQEIDQNSKRSYDINQYDIFHSSLGLASAFAYNYHSLFVPFPFNPTQMMGKVNSGIATFTPFILTSATRIQLPGSFSWPVRLVNLKRALLITRHPIKDSSREMVLINLHLSAYDDGSMRRQESKALQEIIKKEEGKGNYIVVGGDFNQNFPAALSSYIDQKKFEYTPKYALKKPGLWEAFPLNATWFIQNNFQLLADPATPSCRLLNKPYVPLKKDSHQYYLIDGFIVSANIEVISIQTLDEDFMYSDHNPVKMTFKLKD